MSKKPKPVVAEPGFVAFMTLREVQAELRGYRPATADDVRRDEAFLDRRAMLWRQLDIMVQGGR